MYSPFVACGLYEQKLSLKITKNLLS